MSKKDDPPPEFDPDVTITGPLSPPDPDQTVTLRGPSEKMRAALEAMDPEDTVKPMPREPDPDATFSGPLTQFDPDATIGNSGSVRRRSNPFAPKALPEALQANLAALGGLNSLVAFANPILSAVPQIAAARNHPDPRLLKETLQDLIEAFEAGASKIGVQHEVLEGAVYALCCMADDAAASTPWGRDWTSKGLLHELRGERDGGAGFYSLLEDVRKKPEENAQLLELIYICLALGFRGRYRDQAGGEQEANRIRSELHALIALRRPRPPDGLSGQWRPATSGTAARVAPPAAAFTQGAAEPSAPWRAIGIAAAALLILFIGYRLLRKPAEVFVPPAPAVATAPAPEPVLTRRQKLEQALSSLLQGGAVVLAEEAGSTTIRPSHERQFASGSVDPDPAVQSLLGELAAALDQVPGRILVRGYADSVPVKPDHFRSNVDLSAARAKAAAALIGARVREPQRVASEGAGEADPIAPNDTEDNRARNRRIAIVLGPL